MNSARKAGPLDADLDARLRRVVAEGNERHRRDDYVGAIGCYENGLAVARQLGDRAREAGLLSDMGVAYRALGRLRDAFDCTDRAVSMAQSIPEPSLEALALLGRGSVRAEVGDVGGAKVDYARAQVLASRSDPTLEATARSRLAELDQPRREMKAYTPEGALERLQASLAAAAPDGSEEERNKFLRLLLQAAEENQEGKSKSRKL